MTQKTTKTDKFSGYQPRHKGLIEEVFCNQGCVTVDKILVPFPDCKTHGGEFPLGKMAL